MLYRSAYTVVNAGKSPDEEKTAGNRIVVLKQDIENSMDGTRNELGRTCQQNGTFILRIRKQRMKFLGH